MQTAMSVCQKRNYDFQETSKGIWTYKTNIYGNLNKYPPSMKIAHSNPSSHFNRDCYLLRPIYFIYESLHFPSFLFNKIWPYNDIPDISIPHAKKQQKCIVSSNI